MRVFVLLAILLGVSVVAAGSAHGLVPLPEPSTIVGNCGVVRIGEFGCSDAQCEACVCGENPSCCSAPGVAAGAAAGGTGWDGACVFIAGGLPEPDCTGVCLVANRRTAPVASSAGIAVISLVLVAFAAYRLRREAAH